MFTIDTRSPDLKLNSYPNYRDFRDRNTAFRSLSLYVPVMIDEGHVDEAMALLEQAMADAINGAGSC